MSERKRIERLPAEAAKEAGSAVGIPEMMGDLAVFQILLRNPLVAAALNGMLSTLLSQGTLDARLRELVIMRIGWRTGSVYEWTQHWRLAAQLEVDPDDILAVRDWQASDRLGPAERAVLAATDETLEDGTISDATWAACVEHVGGDAQLIELVVAIGNWRLFSSLLRSLRVPLEDGVAPWPPDGVSPP